MATTGEVIVRRAALELGVVAANESLTAPVADLFLGTLNMLVDQWNASRMAVYASNFQTFTLPTNQNPITIGPTAADWTVTQRPVRIEAADLVIQDLGQPTEVRNGITINTSRWWMDLDTPGIQTAYPTDLYYEPAWPNGNIFFYPVPTTAYPVTLQLPAVLGSYALATTFSMPQGYEAALMYTLAEWCATPMGVAVPTKTAQLAAMARVIIFGNNIEPVGLVTLDAGMPTSAGTNRPTWNWYTGEDVVRTG